MPLSNGLVSKMSIGAKTWRPKPADEIALEAEQRKATELEQMRLKGMEKKIETMQNLRKLEGKSQRLNDMAASAELRAEAADQEIRERGAQEAKRRELARMELAKREGLQNLSEAEIARIRRDRMKAELLARAAGTHAANQPMLSHMDLGGPRPPTRLPPLPIPPPPPRTPRMMSPPHLDHIPQPIMNTLPPPILGARHHARIPSEPGVRLRRLSGGTLHGGLSGGSVHGGMPGGSLHGGMPGGSLHGGMPGGSIPGGMPGGSIHGGMPGGSMHGGLSGGPMHGAPPFVGLGRGNNGWGLPGGGLRGAPPGMPLGAGRGRGARMPLRGIGPPMRHRYGMPVPRNAGRTFFRDVFAERALRMQAERLRQRKLESLDIKARQHALRAQALREMRQRELATRLRERGLQQREIEAQVRMMGERERALNEAQLRELRERDHRIQLKERGLQEREVLEQLRHREELEREALRVETDRLERDLRNEELADAERAIRHAMERREAPPLGIARPSLAEMRAEGFLEDELFEGFQRLDERERHNILTEDGLEFGDSELLHLRPPSTGGLRARTPLGGHRHAMSVGGRTPLMRDNDLMATMTPRQRDEMMLREEMAREDRLGTREAELAAMTPRMRETEMLRGGRTPSMMDDMEFARERDGHGLLRPSSRGSMHGSMHGDIIRPSSRGSMRESDFYSATPRRQPLALPMAGRPSGRGGLTADELGLGAAAALGERDRERIHLDALRSQTARGANDDLLHARLQDAAHNREVNGGRRSRANSRAADTLDDDLRRAELAAELAGSGGAGVGDFVGGGGGGLSAGNIGLAGRGSRSRAASMVGLEAQEAALREREMRNRAELASEFGGFSGRHPENALVRREERDLERDMLAGGGSAARRGMSMERPASRIERELYEHEGGSQVGGFGGGSLAGYSDADLDRMSEEELQLLLQREDPHGMGFSESPPFGGPRGPGGAAAGLGADLAAAGGARYARSAGGSPHGRMDVIHGMPGAYGEQGGYGDGYGDGYGQEGYAQDGYGEEGYGQDYDPYEADDGYGENEFTVTEHPEPEDPGVRIVERLGRVEAEGDARRGLGEDGMHDAVNNLITTASRRGANGVVSLRVVDGPGGSFIASGEAVVLS